MRLLNTESLELEFFPTDEKPLYAILSHTWGPEEVLYDDAREGPVKLRACSKKGLRKVLKSADIARNDGYQYVWIDTCCIDKSSSAELSEAINSMFSWYRKAHICYAFLEDYTHRGNTKQLASRWFTRGWTLQELIAPLDVQFYDSSWTWFGDKQFLSADIARITTIDERLLKFTITRSPQCDNKNEHQDVPEEIKACRICRQEALPASTRLIQAYSISTKMSWAAARETTRVEDIAYCMMGIFDVNMPLLYGEGIKAFRRLQEEIVRRSNDQTI
ncbi:heterokaryon incompatibility protein-domain-containing protein, partial [Cercophora newfieldiana]